MGILNKAMLIYSLFPILPGNGKHFLECCTLDLVSHLRESCMLRGGNCVYLKNLFSKK